MQQTDALPQLQAIQDLMAKQQFAQASAQLELLLSEHPEHIDALYMAGVCCRYQQRNVDAQGYLDQLFALQLEHGRAFQEQGHLYRQQQRPVEALQAFIRATQINPVLEASWRAQAELAKGLVKPDVAKQAVAQVQRLQRLPKAQLAITDLLSQGKLLKAENLCRQVLQRQPKNVGIMCLLANIGSRLGAMQEAELLLESAVAFQPDDVQVRIDYIQLLRKRQKFAAALTQSEHLLALAPDNPQFQSIYAIEALQTGDYDLAIAYFDRVLKKLPNDVNTLVSRGHALKTAGSTDAAIDSYRAAAQVKPDHGEAYYSLANLKTYRFTAEEVEAMQLIESQPQLTLMDRVYVYFALGKAFEDQQDMQRSFDYYQRGNALKKQQSGYSAEKMHAELELQQQFFTESKSRLLKNCGNAAPDPIFILGLPRAGSTMLEQILSSHSMVDGTLELPNVLALSQELRRLSIDDKQPGYPDVIGHLDNATLKELGSRYLEETRIHRQQAPFFIDKMPNNFRHIGLIKAILPNAKVIDARRHPMACCFSAFKQLFAEGQEFSYSLSDLAQYYGDYVALMEHWDAVFPGDIHRVYYENVVADLDAEVRSLLDYCGLPFEAQCLDFHKTQRAVRTASSEQVRQPIYKTGVDQWRQYEQQLAEMHSLLGDLISDYPA